MKIGVASDVLTSVACSKLKILRRMKRKARDLGTNIIGTREMYGTGRISRGCVSQVRELIRHGKRPRGVLSEIPDKGVRARRRGERG